MRSMRWNGNRETIMNALHMFLAARYEYRQAVYLSYRFAVKRFVVGEWGASHYRLEPSSIECSVGVN